MAWHQAGQALEPPQRQLGQDCALVWYGGGQHDVVDADPVRGDHDQVIAVGIPVADLPECTSFMAPSSPGRSAGPAPPAAPRRVRSGELGQPLEDRAEALDVALGPGYLVEPGSSSACPRAARGRAGSRGTRADSQVCMAAAWTSALGVLAGQAAAISSSRTAEVKIRPWLDSRFPASARR